MSKTINSKKEYSNNGEYWSRNTAYVMGDVRQRPNLLKLIGDVRGKKVLDAGSGTGYLSRRIHELGAEVYGCEIEPDMFKIAQDEEQRNPLGIKYVLADIKDTPYDDNLFDVALSVGVLFHLDQSEWIEYLNESRRILKHGGELYISIEHPFLFTEQSPTRSGKQCWAIHRPISEGGYKLSQIFEEKYYKSDGELFISSIWQHSIEFMVNAIVDSGFKIEKINEIMVEKDDLKSEFWGNEYGYPAFIQFKLRKTE